LRVDFENIVRWKQIPGFSSYEASDTGLIRRSHAVSVRHPITMAPLRPRALKRGHSYVNIRNDDGVIKSVYVHRLIAMAFLGPPPSPKHQVAHWDGDATNNHLPNLRWATNKENSQDSVRLGRSARPTGEKAGKARLTDDQAAAVRREPHIGCREWGRRLGVSHSVISQIKRGLSYKDISC
jgi:hypothetical protein